VKKRTTRRDAALIKATNVDEAITADYRPSLGVGGYVGLGSDTPLWMGPWLIERMRQDPNIRLALAALFGPLSRCEFEIEAARPEWEAFARQQMKAVWRNSDRFVGAAEYGEFAAEVLYRQDDRFGLTIDGLKEFYPRDCLVVTDGGRYAGIDIVSGGQFPTTATDGRLTLPGISSLWLTFDARFGSWYGSTIMRRAWRWWEPLRRLPDGLYQSLALAGYKFAFEGSHAHVEDSNGIVKNGQFAGRTFGDVVQQQLELARNGSVVTFPMANGKKRVEIEKPSAMPVPDVLMESVRRFEDLLFQSIGVPPEVIRSSAQGGSGFAGRSIPMSVLYDGINGLASSFSQQIAERLINPLLAYTFGPDARAEITPLPLDMPQEPGEAGADSVAKEAAAAGASTTAPGGGVEFPPAAKALQLSLAQSDVKVGRRTREQAAKQIAWSLGMTVDGASQMLALEPEVSSVDG
jgi:hypothetical protein